MGTLRFGTGLVRGAAATVQTARPALEPAPLDTSFDSIPEDNLTRPLLEYLPSCSSAWLWSFMSPAAALWARLALVPSRRAQGPPAGLGP